eukprot:jgi/Ulvmu1/12486/UM009_0139.1
MASDVRRFVTYLRDSPKLGGKPDSSTSDGPHALVQPSRTDLGASRTRIVDINYDEIRQLLSKFKNDHRVRHVLMQTSDESLEQALESVQSQLRNVENVSIIAYIGEADPLIDLHGRIAQSSSLLQKVEGRLGHFDFELNGVNREIQTLEEDSDQLSIMLRNRIAAAEKLGAWLQNTTVPPALVQGVTAGNVSKGKQFAQTLGDVRIKYSNMQAFAGHEHLPAFPTLQGLIMTACERLKAYLLTAISGLKPSGSGTSNAVIRRQSLLEYSDYIDFLRDFSAAAHTAVIHKYIEDNRAYLMATVRAYMAGLWGAVIKKPRRVLVTAAESGSRLTNMFATGAASDTQLQEFELGQRPEELLLADFSRWPHHMAKRGGRSSRTITVYRPIPLQSLGKQKITLEHAFKALMHQVCDAGAGEFVFLEEFFGPDAQTIFDECWKPVLAMVCSELDDHLHAYFDVVGVLIMTRIVGHCQLLMTHAQVPVLDSCLDRMGLMLWPHYSRLIREHIEAITNDKNDLKAKALKPSVPAVLTPVLRWVRLFSSIAQLNAEYGDSQIHNNLEELSKAMNTLLYRVKMLFAKPIHGHVFYILNLHYIIDHLIAANKAPLKTLLSSEMLPSNSGGLGTDVMELLETFEQSLKVCQRQYKGECLGSHMPEMYRYTTVAEKLRSSGASAEQAVKDLGDAAIVQKCMRYFKDRWRQMVGVIRQEVHAHFSASEACQRDMTHTCLEAMYEMYKTFLEALNSQREEVRAVVNEGPSLQTLAYELREMAAS